MRRKRLARPFLSKVQRLASQIENGSRRLAERRPWLDCAMRIKADSALLGRSNSGSNCAKALS